MNLEKEAEDSYTVTCPQLGCIFVHEESKEAAIRYACEAIDEYIEISLRHEDPIPAEVILDDTIDNDTPPTTLSGHRIPVGDVRPTTLTVTRAYDYS